MNYQLFRELRPYTQNADNRQKFPDTVDPNSFSGGGMGKVSEQSRYWRVINYSYR